MKVLPYNLSSVNERKADVKMDRWKGSFQGDSYQLTMFHHWQMLKPI